MDQLRLGVYNDNASHLKAHYFLFFFFYLVALILFLILVLCSDCLVSLV